jgi:hypothetical protein
MIQKREFCGIASTTPKTHCVELKFRDIAIASSGSKKTI